MAPETAVQTERVRRLSIEYGDPKDVNQAAKPARLLAWNSLWVANRQNSLRSVSLQRKASRDEALRAWQFQVRGRLPALRHLISLALATMIRTLRAAAAHFC